MVTGKAPEYKRFWMGNEKGLGRVEIKPRIDKVIDMSRVSDNESYKGIGSRDYYFSMLSLCAFWLM